MSTIPYQHRSQQTVLTAPKEHDELFQCSCLLASRIVGPYFVRPLLHVHLDSVRDTIPFASCAVLAFWLWEIFVDVVSFIFVLQPFLHSIHLVLSTPCAVVQVTDVLLCCCDEACQLAILLCCSVAVLLFCLPFFVLLLCFCAGLLSNFCIWVLSPGYHLNAPGLVPAHSYCSTSMFPLELVNRQ